MWRRSGLLGILVSLVLVLSLAVPAFAVEPIPHSFYGTVTIGELPAPEETEIIAVVEGGGGSITTTVEGEYGSPAPLGPKLVVAGEIEGGALIEFYIDGAKADQTANFYEGFKTELDLTFPVGLPEVSTADATDITTSSATLNGSLDSLGDYSSVDVSFKWGTTSGALDQETSPPRDEDQPWCLQCRDKRTGPQHHLLLQG